MGARCGHPTPSGPCRRTKAAGKDDCGVDHARPQRPRPTAYSAGADVASADPIGTSAAANHGPPAGDDLDPLDARLLDHHGIAREVAAAYPARFDANDVIDLTGHHIDPEAASAYPSHLTSADIVDLQGGGVPAHRAAMYPTRFRGRHIVRIENVGGTGSEAARYDPHIFPDDVCKYVEAGFDAHDVNTYPRWLAPDQVRELADAGVDGLEATRLLPEPASDDAVTRAAERTRG